MPTPQFSAPDINSFEGLRDYVIKLQRDMQYLLTNLDDLNINRLDARVIVAESITADKIAAKSITADQIAANTITANEIAANSITADRMNVSQLSAISADLGTITAGSITSNATINVGTDVNVGRNIYLDASNTSSSKGIIFHDNGATVARIDVTSGDIGINSSGYVLLNGGSGAYANGGRIAVEGISVAFDVLDADGVTPRTLTFVGGTLRSIT